MTDGPRLRFDRCTLIVCALGALLSAGLTFGAADLDATGLQVAAIVIFFVMGLVPYGVTVLLSTIRSYRRLVVATTRATAVVYGVFDCGLRYLALYHPTGSTDAVVVAVLPFWYLPIVLAMLAVMALVQWLRPEPIRPDSTPSQV